MRLDFPAILHYHAQMTSKISPLLAILFLPLAGCSPPPPPPGVAGGPSEEVAGDTGDETGVKKPLGKEKFASIKVSRNTSNSRDAEAYIKNFDGSIDVKLGPEDSNNHSDEDGTCASWVFHSPLQEVNRADGSVFPDAKQLSVDGDGVYIWAKTQHRGLPGFRVAAYYRRDGKEPFGSWGVGEGESEVAFFEYSHNSPSDADGSDSWWRVGPLPLPTGENSFTYKIGTWRE